MHRFRSSLAYKLVLIAFWVNVLVPIPWAQTQAQDWLLPAPGGMVPLSPPFDPPMLKGIKVHSDNPFRFDFVLNQGDSLKEQSTHLIKYFLASLTIPEKDLWVNLSPYEKDRIIPQSFGLTEMGRDLLAEDYMLKQITASLIYPEGEVGKRFWKRVYQEADRKYGTTNVAVNTFNKVWIVPDKAVVYENAKAGAAYIVEAKLKVMLEEDYLALRKHTPPADPAPWRDQSVGASQILREIVIPELTVEVNEGKNFSKLRQVYNSLILATWYKKKIKDSILAQVYADKNKIAGINDDKNDTELIYQRYLQAFKKGVYNYIKEERDPLTQQIIPRKYFSGGVEFQFGQGAVQAMVVTDLPSVVKSKGDLAMATIDVEPTGQRTARTRNPLSLRQAFQTALRARIEELQEQGTDLNDVRLKNLFRLDRRLQAPYEQEIKSLIEKHQVIRVLQFNQLGNPTRERLEQMKQAMAQEFENFPNIVTLQEITARPGEYNTAVEAALVLGYKYQEYLESQTNPSGNKNGLAIVYHPSFEQIKMFHLLESLPGKEREVILLGLQLRSKITGKDVYIFNCHLTADLNAQSQRQGELRMMKQYIQRMVPGGQPIVWAGDFNYLNEEEGQEGAGLIADFTDSFRSTNPHLKGITTSKQYRFVEFPGKRPDYIYAAGLTPLSSRVVLNENPVSDHFGLLSDLAWGDVDPKLIVHHEDHGPAWFEALLPIFFAHGPMDEEKIMHFLVSSGLALEDKDIADIILSLVSRETKVKFVWHNLGSPQWEAMEPQYRGRILSIAQGIPWADREYDEYEQLLIDNFKITQDPLIEEILKKNAQEYIGRLDGIPRETLVVIQAAGKSSRLNAQRPRSLDKNTEKLGGVSQLQRNLNVLAALGYQHVLVIHNENNKRRVEAEIQQGHYPAFMKVDLMDGSRREWLENFAEGLKWGSQQGLKRVLLLSGESPVSIDYLAAVRFSIQNNIFLFSPAQNYSVHKITEQGEGSLASYELKPGEGNKRLVSLSASIDGLSAYLFNAGGYLVGSRSLETYIESVKKQPTAQAVFLREEADNIDFIDDLEKLKAEYSTNVASLGRFKAEVPIFPQRLARAVLIKNGYFYGFKNVKLLTKTHHSNVWSTDDKELFIKAQLFHSPFFIFPSMFNRIHYENEKWFYSTPMSIAKPVLVAVEDRLGVIVTKNVNPQEKVSLADAIEASELGGQSPVGSSAFDQLSQALRDSMQLLVEMQRSPQASASYSLQEIMEAVTIKMRKLAELNFDVPKDWIGEMDAVREHYAHHPTPLVISHGDFGPANLLLTQPMAVVDGEYASKAAPAEKDLAVNLVRLMQILNRGENIFKMVETYLDAYQRYSHHQIDFKLLYFFMVEKFIESAYEVVYFQQDNLLSRKNIEFARELMALMQATYVKDNDIPGASRDMERVFFNARDYTNILDHLRYGRIDDTQAAYQDSNGFRGIKLYYLARGKDYVFSLLDRFEKDREPIVRENAKRAKAILDHAMQTISAKSTYQKTNETGGIDLTKANVGLKEIYHQGVKIKFHIDLAQLSQLQEAPGFVPVIVNIQLGVDLKTFLGIKNVAV